MLENLESIKYHLNNFLEQGNFFKMNITTTKAKQNRFIDLAKNLLSGLNLFFMDAVVLVKILRKFSITAVFRCAVILEAAAGVVL